MCGIRHTWFMSHIQMSHVRGIAWVMWDTTPSFVKHDPYVTHTNESCQGHCMGHVGYDPPICETWPMQCPWHDSFVCVTWIMYACHDSLFTCATSFIHLWDVTQSHTRHGSFIRWHDSLQMCRTNLPSQTELVPTTPHKMCHVTRMHESSHWYERVMSHIQINHVQVLDESCHAYDWRMTWLI